MASGPRRPFRTLVLLAVLLVVGVPGGVWAWFAVDGGPLDGMLVEGVVLRAGDDPEEIVRRHADAWLETQLTVDAGPLVTSATRLQLGARVDIDGALERIRSAGRTGNPLADLRDLGAARDGELDVVLRAYVDRDAALRYLGSLRGRVERSPIPAVIGSDRRVTPGVPG